MPTEYQGNWSSWSEVSEEAQRMALADPNFWVNLNDSQKQSFIELADWTQLRQVEQAKEAKLAMLVSIQDVVEKCDLTRDTIYSLITLRGFPAWLVDGRWKFDLRAVYQWIDQNMEKEAIRT